MYNEDDCLSALQRVAGELCHSPSVSEYRQHQTDSEPSAKSIQDKLGSWNEAKRRVGLDTYAYTETDVQTALTRVADKLGHSPSVSEYREHGRDSEPSAKSVRDKLGSWNEAKQQAGLDTYAYTETDVVTALARVADKLGYNPTQSAYRQHRTDAEPSINVMCRVFGSWADAKQQVGLGTGGYSEDDVVTALTRVADKLGHSPTQTEYDGHKQDAEPSTSRICGLLGSWNEAKQQAGLDTEVSTRQLNYTEDDVVTALTRVADKLGHSPSLREYREHGRDSEPSESKLYTLFESWNEAKHRAGLDTRGYSQTDVVTALTRVADKLGHSPSLGEYRQHRTDAEPSATAICSTVDSWNEAKQQAGLDTEVSNRQLNYSQEDTILALTRVANELGHSPSLREYRQHQTDAEPSTVTIRNNCGSWNGAKRLCSLATYHDGGGVSYPYGSGWSHKATDIVRESGECLNCGIPAIEYAEQTGQRLDVHHIHKLRSFYQTLSDEQKEMFDTDNIPEQLTQEVEKRADKANHQSNLVPLCRDCHNSKVEPLSVEEQVEMLGIEMPEVSPEKPHSSAERNRLRQS